MRIVYLFVLLLTLAQLGSADFLISFTGAIATYDVTTTGFYSITAAGAQGGNGVWAPDDAGGLGALVSGTVCTVPVPDWVKAALDEWTKAAGVGDGRVFRYPFNQERPVMRSRAKRGHHVEDAIYHSVVSEQQD